MIEMQTASPTDEQLRALARNIPEDNRAEVIDALIGARALVYSGMRGLATVIDLAVVAGPPAKSSRVFNLALDLITHSDRGVDWLADNHDGVDLLSRLIAALRAL